MSKYEPLGQFLARQTVDSITLDFAEIEQELGFPLPSSAYRYNAWWANQSGKGHAQPACWQDVGWKTRDVDLRRKTVSFERADRAASPKKPDADFGIEPHIWQTAHLLTGITDRSALVRSALRQLMAKYAAVELMAMGGSSPDAQIPERRRPAA